MSSYTPRTCDRALIDSGVCAAASASPCPCGWTPDRAGAVEATEGEVARAIYEAASDAADASWEDLSEIGGDALYRRQANALLAVFHVTRREVVA